MTWQSQQLPEERARCFLPRRAALKIPALVAAGAVLLQAPAASAEPGRWSPDRAHRWYRAQERLVGANFITSNSINQLEMFQPNTYDASRIDAEMRIAGLIGLNTVRVFLHDQLWTQDRAGFQLRLAQLVGCAARYGIKPLFVLFDSCWDPLPRLGQQRAPRPGVHNSGWVQSPGAERLSLKSKSIAWHWELMFTRSLHNYDLIAQQRTLARVAQLVDDGVLRSTITKSIESFDAAGLIEAHRDVESGRMVGKVVVHR